MSADFGSGDFTAEARRKAKPFETQRNGVSGGEDK
jgi:hypothetical protein